MKSPSSRRRRRPPSPERLEFLEFARNLPPDPEPFSGARMFWFNVAFWAFEALQARPSTQPLKDALRTVAKEALKLREEYGGAAAYFAKDIDEAWLRP